MCERVNMCVCASVRPCERVCVCCEMVIQPIHTLFEPPEGKSTERKLDTSSAGHNIGPPPASWSRPLHKSAPTGSSVFWWFRLLGVRTPTSAVLPPPLQLLRPWIHPREHTHLLHSEREAQLMCHRREGKLILYKYQTPRQFVLF